MAGLTSVSRARAQLLKQAVQHQLGAGAAGLHRRGLRYRELYSAANGDMQPWAATQMVRFGIALVPMIGAALLGIRHWFRAAYWMYAVALVLVVAVDLRGFVGMGARRWIDLGLIQLQPSSLMKIALVLALARYFQPAPMRTSPVCDT